MFSETQERIISLQIMRPELTRKEFAKKIGISEATLERHKIKIAKKSVATNYTGAIVMAILKTYH